MPAVNNWTIIVSPYNPELRSAKFECPKCRQSMLTSDPDKAIFRHCSQVDFLTQEQRAILSGTASNTVAEVARLDFRTQEVARNRQSNPTFNTKAAFEAELPAMRADANAFEEAKRKQEVYNLTTRTPRQPGKEFVQSEQYIPGVHET